MQVQQEIKQYLYIPYAKCKNCKHFDGSSTRAYKCHVLGKCPAFDVEIVVQGSVRDLAKRYKQANTENDFSTMTEILTTVAQRGKGFEYKFKQEVTK